MKTLNGPDLISCCLLGILGLLSSCAGVTEASDDTEANALEVWIPVSEQTHDRPIPSEGYFAFLPQISRTYEDPRIDAARVNAVIRNGIEEAMTSAGYESTTLDQADLWIAYVAALERELGENELRSIYGFEPRQDEGAAARLRLEKGTLIIDVISASSQRLLWRALVQESVDFEIGREQRLERVRAAVRAMLGRFPGN